MVRAPDNRRRSASPMTSLISLMPLDTALKLMNSERVWLAMTRARVVLPTPGGPQNIMEGSRSEAIIRRRIFPSPSRCCCPAMSSRLSGRIRLASGSSSFVVNRDS